MVSMLGSSPLARGLLVVGDVVRDPGQDHPRSRGVYLIPPDTRAASRGSSPLARGLPPSPGPWGWRRRIIPARAGFTPYGKAVKHHDADHPRSRGVYSGPGSRLARSCGSSPLARGLLHERIHRDADKGIIPARAGFTSIRSRTISRPRDHPRSRGVYHDVAHIILS